MVNPLNFLRKTVSAALPVSAESPGVQAGDG